MLEGPFSRFLFERGEAASLSDVLGPVLEWRKLEPTLGHACTAHVEENFTGQAMIDGIERIFLQVGQKSSVTGHHDR